MSAHKHIICKAATRTLRCYLLVSRFRKSSFIYFHFALAFFSHFFCAIFIFYEPSLFVDAVLIHFLLKWWICTRWAPIRLELDYLVPMQLNGDTSSGFTCKKIRKKHENREKWAIQKSRKGRSRYSKWVCGAHVWQCGVHARMRLAHAYETGIPISVCEMLFLIARRRGFLFQLMAKTWKWWY